MGSSLDHRRHRLTPSFADSAIDLDPSENRHQLSGQDSREKTLGDRLNRLALLAAKRNDISEHDSGTIGNCLDTLESLLDPRSDSVDERVGIIFVVANIMGMLFSLPRTLLGALIAGILSFLRCTFSLPSPDPTLQSTDCASEAF